MNNIINQPDSNINLSLSRLYKFVNKYKEYQPNNNSYNIHIAGTNGKGSTAYYLYQMLAQHKQFDIGLYISPHINNICERIRINNNYIDNIIFEQYFEDIQTKSKALLSSNNQLTYFEIITLIAYRYFAQSNNNINIYETGLGGRYDATNILNSNLAIITNIDYDHMNYLGNNIFNIAYQKAGIIKNSQYYILGYMPSKIRNTIKQYAISQKSKYIKRNKKINKYNKKENNYQKINYNLAIHSYNHICRQLNIKPIYISYNELNIWQGRYEKKYINNKLIIIDSAHNLAGIKALIKNLKQDKLEKQSKTIILGMLKDKNINNIINYLICEKIISSNDKLILTYPSHENLSDNINIIEKSYINQINIIAIPEPNQAYEYAINNQNNEYILIIGSIYMLGNMNII